MSDISTLVLEIQTNKCHLSCRHCYASGFKVHRDELPLSTAIEIVEKVSLLSSGNCYIYLYKDIIECSYLSLFAEYLKDRGMIKSLDPLPTHGWPRDKNLLPDQLSSLASNGVEAVWLTVHGLQDEHDRFVRRPGAFRQLLQFAHAASSYGLKVIWNLSLRRSNFDAIMDLVQSTTFSNISSDFRLAVAAHIGNAKKLDNDRPTIDQVRILEASGLKASTPLFSEDEWINRVKLGIFSAKPLEGYAEVRVMPDLTIWLHDFPEDRIIGHLRESSLTELRHAIYLSPSYISDLKSQAVQPRIKSIAFECGEKNSNMAHCEYSIVSTWLNRVGNIKTEILGGRNGNLAIPEQTVS